MFRAFRCVSKDCGTNYSYPDHSLFIAFLAACDKYDLSSAGLGGLKAFFFLNFPDNAR